MENVTRIGVSLEPALLESFDRLISRKGYPTRSEAVRELINDALAREALEDEDAHAVGTIILLYDHHRSSVKDNLMETQHSHHDVITSTVHVHLDNEKCLEVLIVHGSVADINELSERLTHVKGIMQGGPTLIAGEPSEHEHKHEGKK
jgi:CopG family nickel-responsive transcriptional regulator